MPEHHYHLTTQWTGNTGQGTAAYHTYQRSYTIRIEGKAVIEGSSDPDFRGDVTRHNPEELLLASLSSCHMLWYLHLCADAGVVVTGYTDQATATMEKNATGGRFVEVMLKPVVTIAAIEMAGQALALHQQANQHCFIASSVNFPVKHQASIRVKQQ